MLRTATISTDQKHIEAVFNQIPGLPELLNTQAEIDADTIAQYPDAAFVYQLVREPVHHDSEINQINYQAIKSILNGENVASVHYRRDREMDQYLQKHMWDA